MKFIPKLFNTEMVIALLNGTKNQTRRTKGLEKVNRNPDNFVVKQITDLFYFTNNFTGKTFLINPPANVGDVLWVRENYLIPPKIVTNKMLKDGADTWPSLDYQADCELGDIEQYKEWGWNIKPSIFMPKEACRLFLEVTEITVERLNDISESDAINEGIHMTWISDNPNECKFKNYINNGRGSLNAQNSFFSLWESINGKKSLELNPWVWVIKFKKIDKPSNF